MAHLRLQDDAGLLRAAVSDLLHLGRPKYEYLLRATEAAGHRLSKRCLAFREMPVSLLSRITGCQVLGQEALARQNH